MMYNEWIDRVSQMTSYVNTNARLFLTNASTDFQVDRKDARNETNCVIFIASFLLPKIIHTIFPLSYIFVASRSYLDISSSK